MSSWWCGDLIQGTAWDLKNNTLQKCGVISLDLDIWWTYLIWNYLRFADGVKISMIWPWTDPDLLLMEVTFWAIWWKIWGWSSSNSLKIIMTASLPDKVGDTGDVWSCGGEGWSHGGLQLWQRDPAVCSLQSLRRTTKREWKELSSRTHTGEMNNAVSKLPHFFNFTLVTFTARAMRGSLHTNWIWPALTPQSLAPSPHIPTV